MKTLKRLLILVALLFLSRPVLAAESGKYDLLSKVLQPFLEVLAKNGQGGNRALVMQFRLEWMTDLPAALVGTPGKLEVQYPDKLRLTAPLKGVPLTLCRNGAELWVYPGSRVAPLLAGLPKPPGDEHLGKFQLPVPAKQLVFLPMLFILEDLGLQPLESVSYRVLDVQLMPELARGLKVQGWSAQLWIDPANRPARIVVARKGWELAVRLSDLKFAESLPATTWQPTPEQAADVLKLSPAQYQALLKGL